MVRIITHYDRIVVSVLSVLSPELSIGSSDDTPRVGGMPEVRGCYVRFIKRYDRVDKRFVLPTRMAACGEVREEW